MIFGYPFFTRKFQYTTSKFVIDFNKKLENTKL